MAELQLEPFTPAYHTKNSGDAWYNDSIQQMDVSIANHLIGRTSGKAGVNYGSVNLYNTGSLPLGVVLNDAKIEMRANSTKSGAFTMYIDVLNPAGDERFQAISQRIHPIGFHYTPDSVGGPVTSAWTNQVTSPDIEMKHHYDERYGVGNFAQAWTCNTTGTLQAHVWNGHRQTALGAGTVTCNVYASSGSAGSYTKGALLATSSTYDIDAIFPMTTSAAATLTGITAVGGGAFSITSGTVYISELAFNATSGSNHLTIDADESPPSANDNALVSAASGNVLQGFAEHNPWLDGGEIVNATVAGTTDSFAAPSFTNGQVYSFGSSGYSPDTTLTNFLANLQAALDARTTPGEYIAITIGDFVGAVDNRNRDIHSTKSTTATVGSLSGVVLTIDYVATAAGGVKTLGRVVTPAVGTFGVASSEAVDTRGAEAVSAVSNEGLDAAEAVGNYGLEALESVAVAAVEVCSDDDSQAQ